MTEALAIVWFAAAIGGVVAVVLGLVDRTRRHASLMWAGVSFGVAGVLGILSIGVIFLVSSAACFIAASRTDRASATAASDA